MGSIKSMYTPVYLFIWIMMYLAFGEPTTFLPFVFWTWCFLDRRFAKAVGS